MANYNRITISSSHEGEEGEKGEGEGKEGRGGEGGGEGEGKGEGKRRGRGRENSLHSVLYLLYMHFSVPLVTQIYSPVIMTVLIAASLSVVMTGVVSGFSVFSMAMSPAKVRSHST